MALLSACARVPTRQLPGPTDAGGVVTLRILSRQDAALDAAISAYYDLRPNVRIDKIPPSPGGGGMLSAIRVRAKAGEVDLVPVEFPDELVAEGLVLALDPLIQRAGLDLRPYGSGLDQLRIGGRLYELPYAIRPLVLTYNPDIFAAAGVPGPAPGWTWDQFRETAQRLSTGIGYERQWGFASAPGDFSLPLLWLASKGGSGSLAGVEEQAIGEALQYFSTLTFTDQSMPVADSNGRPYFQEGRAGMGLTALFDVGRLPGYSVAPTPTFPGAQPQAIASTSSYGIAASSPQKEAAFDFLQFLAGPAGALTSVKAGVLPAYRTAEAKQAFQERRPAPPVGLAPLFDQPWTILPRGGQESPGQKRLNAFGKAAQATLSGELDWNAALAEYRRSIAQIETDSD